MEDKAKIKDGACIKKGGGSVSLYAIRARSNIVYLALTQYRMTLVIFIFSTYHSSTMYEGISCPYRISRYSSICITPYPVRLFVWFASILHSL